MANTRPSNRLRRDPGQEPMQRIRVGVTGLAAVVLIVLLAAAIATSIRRTASMNETNATVSLPIDVKSTNSKSVDPNAEPLAQLGVAPAANERKDASAAVDKHPN